MKLQFKVIHLVFALALTGCSQKSPEELLANAQQKVALNQASDAIIDLKNVIRAEPRNTEARFLLGDLYLGQGDAASAEKELQRALDLGKNIELVLPKLLKSLNMLDKKSDILPMIELHKNGQVELMPQVLFYAGLADLASMNIVEVLAVEPNIQQLPEKLAEKGVELVSLTEALERANVLLVLVDHKPFKALSINDVNTKVVVDTRGLFSQI
jgi:predicted Zn-dependent protease